MSTHHQIIKGWPFHVADRHAEKITIYGWSTRPVPQVIDAPTRIPVPGGKVIDEYVGRVTTGTEAVSVAHMRAPAGWYEPAQTPEFDEVTLVLAGSVVVEYDGGRLDVPAGRAVVTRASERVRYSAGPAGAEYVAVCLPAFAPDLAHREE